MFIQSLSLASVNPFSPHFPKCLCEFVCVHECNHSWIYKNTCSHEQTTKYTYTKTQAQHHIAGVKQQQMSLEFALTCQGYLGHGLILRCPIRNALFSPTLMQCRFGLLIRESHLLFVNQHDGGSRAQVGFAETVYQWKGNQCQTNWLHLLH